MSDGWDAGRVQRDLSQFKRGEILEATDKGIHVVNKAKYARDHLKGIRAWAYVKGYWKPKSQRGGEVMRLLKEKFFVGVKDDAHRDVAQRMNKIWHHHLINTDGELLENEKELEAFMKGIGFTKSLDPNQTDAQGKTPLLFAVEQGNEEIVAKLLRFGADPNAKGPVGNTALHNAGSVEIARQLLEAGAERQTTNDAGQIPLHHIRDKGDRPEIVAFLENPAAYHRLSIEDQRTLDDFARTNEDGCSTLHMAAKLGRPDIIALIPSPELNINQPAGDGQTPLHLAAALDPGERQNKTMAALLAAPAMRVDVTDRNGRTAAHIAAQTNNAPLLKQLQAAGANLDFADKEGKTPLQLGGSEAVWFLLNESSAEVVQAAMPELTDVLPKTPFGQFMMKHGFKRMDVNAQKADSLYTPAHMAAMYGDYKMLGMLIKAGADLTAKDSTGRTPLYWAVATRQPALVLDLLIKHSPTEVLNDVLSEGKRKTLIASVPEERQESMRAIIQQVESELAARH